MTRRVLETLPWAVGPAGYDRRTSERSGSAKRIVRESPPYALVTAVRHGTFNGPRPAVHLRLAPPTAPVRVVWAFGDAS